MSKRPRPTHQYEHYTKDGKHRVRFADGREVCDFCLTPDPTWSYPTAPMPIAGHPVIGASDWGVCDKCHELLKAGNIGALVRHAVAEQRRQVPPGTVLADGLVTYPPIGTAYAVMRENVLRFMDARNGPPTRANTSTSNQE
jgi:hypothetical protein